MVFTIAQKVNKHLGYFFNKICSQEIPKIVQSGHTGRPSHKNQHLFSSFFGGQDGSGLENIRRHLKFMSLDCSIVGAFLWLWKAYKGCSPVQMFTFCLFLMQQDVG